MILVRLMIPYSRTTWKVPTVAVQRLIESARIMGTSETKRDAFLVTLFDEPTSEHLMWNTTLMVLIGYNCISKETTHMADV